MLNYYLRDVLEEKLKQEIDKMVERTRKEQERTEQIVKESTETPILDKVKELVEKIQQLEEIKKENADGQTENAQPEQG